MLTLTQLRPLRPLTTQRNYSAMEEFRIISAYKKENKNLQDISIKSNIHQDKDNHRKTNYNSTEKKKQWNQTSIFYPPENRRHKKTCIHHYLQQMLKPVHRRNRAPRGSNWHNRNITLGTKKKCTQLDTRHPFGLNIK